MALHNGSRILVLLMVLSGALGESATAQSWIDDHQTSIRVRGGMFWPIAEWVRHRYAPGVDQFKRGPFIGLDLERRISNLLSIEATAAYGLLDLSAWEEYARSVGDDIDASAHFFYVGAVLKVYLLGGVNNFKMASGVVYFSSDGRERFNGLEYDYDFVSARTIGFLSGLEYERFFTRSISISLKADVLIVPAAIRYADARKYTLYGLPTTLGVQFYFR